MRRLVCSLFLLTLATEAVFGWSRFRRPARKEYKSELFHGVVYGRQVRQTPRPLVIHTVSIDLSVVDFLVTPGDDSRGRDALARTTTSFLEEFGVQLAVNGSFFAPFRANAPWSYYPRRGDGVDVRGLAISSGRQYSEPESEYPVLCIANGRVEIRRDGCPAATAHALAGNHMLVERGDRVAGNDDGEHHPRTAVAVGQDGRMVWLVVVDGRQPRYSEGMTLAELADLVLELGVDAALNLDGGGSSTLVMAATGRSQVLNAPIHTAIPMRQRPVANHLGVFAAPSQLPLR